MAERTTLARALSKLGFCSRRQAGELIAAGRVRVNGRACRNLQTWVDLQRDRIEVDSRIVAAARKVYLMLNKPRGLVTTTSDEQGRATVFECLGEAPLPPVSPVGRLDKASEGLLLFTNDTAWGAGITNPANELEKTYHVQINCVADAPLLARLRAGLQAEQDFLSARRARLLSQGARNSWIELVLIEGKNRHIRRMLAVLKVEVRRLMRVAIGPLQLGELAKGKFRHLTESEVELLRSAGSSGKHE